jgi:cytochrome P450/NADPH-cytochrome P450 reductase
MTVKPKVMIRAIPRAGKHILFAAPSSGLRELREGLSVDAKAVSVDDGTNKQALYVLYGSNTGTCESFAQKIATAAPSSGLSRLCGLSHSD